MSRARSMIGLLSVALIASPATGDDDIPDVLGEETRKLRGLMASPVAELRIEGVQGALHLKLAAFEPDLIRLLGDEDPTVRQEAVRALNRCGTAQSVPPLIGLVDDPDWAVAEHAHLTLVRMTGRPAGEAKSAEWQRWWVATEADRWQTRLLAQMGSEDPETRVAAAYALRCFASPAAENRLIKILTEGRRIGTGERALLTDALDRVGTAKSRPYLLQRARVGDAAAAWAVGRRGGKDAEQSLLAGYRRSRRIDFMLNLDRLKSTKCGPLLPILVGRFPSLINSGARSEDLRYPTPPLQRVLTNLIRRSGRAPELIDAVLDQLEGSTDPPPAKDLKSQLDSLCQILKPGFIREGYGGCAAPLAALYHVAQDQSIVPRLIPLLRHQTYTVRIYAALTLGKLRATEAIGPMLDVVKEGYPFSDSTALTSGKHTASFRKIDGKRQRQSQTIRWRGYVCMALGKIGTDEVRQELEKLATDPTASRDVRFGSVVGLRCIGSPDSLHALRHVAKHDIIWMIRDAAERAIADVELMRRAGVSPTDGNRL